MYNLTLLVQYLKNDINNVSERSSITACHALLKIISFCPGFLSPGQKETKGVALSPWTYKHVTAVYVICESNKDLGLTK